MIPAQAIRASTQDHLEIEDIKEGIVILKDGGACLIISVTSINYDLLSEKEQEAIIYAYAGLLNSLNFPIQIVVRSQLKDVSSYINLLNELAEKESQPLIKEQIIKYAKFVAEIVKKNNVLDKKFYIVIPMSPLEIGATKAFVNTFSPVKRRLPFDKAYILQKAKINLYPKRDHVLRQLGRLGLKGRQLETKELIKLFFEIYNPQSPGQQFVEPEQYQRPLVQSTFPTLTFSPSQLTETQTSPPLSQIKVGESSSLILPEEKKEAHQQIFEKINNLVKQTTSFGQGENK
jgi:hypothetical protein